MLPAFFVIQERLRISVHIDHVPGISNDVADALSRDANLSDLDFSPSQAFEVDWSLLSGPRQLQLFPSADHFRAFWLLAPLLECLLGRVPCRVKHCGSIIFGPTATKGSGSRPVLHLAEFCLTDSDFDATVNTNVRLSKGSKLVGLSNVTETD